MYLKNAFEDRPIFLITSCRVPCDASHEAAPIQNECDL